MAEVDFVWRQDDTQAPIIRNLTDSAGDAVSLDGSNDEVRFRMAPLDGGEFKIDAPSTISDADEAEVTYQPAWGDTDTPGLYLADFLVSYEGDDSNPQTFPNEGYLLVQVTPRSGTVPVLGTPSGRDLCTLSDVVRYVPAFTPNDEQTNAALRALISSESETFMLVTKRGVSPPGEEEEPSVRAFVVHEQAAFAGRIEIDDLASLEELTLDDEDVDLEDVTALYGSSRSQRAAWEPITQLDFPADTLIAGALLEVSGTWGFPEIPAFAREAVAKRVILRYLNDVADAGDHFSEAIENVNLGALFASSQDAVEALRLKRAPLLG